ncbi:MAG TPA: DUF4097 family beta strand repeat-containing protein [Gemmatimonadaceae bacterium]|nr:DUF4097 family beta strand repeat-containing protein [Gemmatimonadaceae bacterium]
MRALRLALSLAALLPSLAAGQILGRDAEVFTRTEAVARGEWFRFYGPIGDVTVTEGTGTQVEFRAQKILRSGRVTDIAFELRRTGEGVTICAVFEDDDECTDDGLRSDRRRNWSRNFRPPTLNVTIKVPAGVRLAVHSGNGDVSVTGAHAELIARSGNGRVRVTGTAGEVDAASGNGEVTVESVRGPVRANSGNGDVRVTTVQGPVSATSGNGDLLVRMTELRAASDMEFTTGNGRIEVTVPAEFNADIDASTGNGGIRTDFPIQVSGRMSKTRLRGTIGQGGRRLRLVTGNGEIEIRKG